MKLEDAAVNEDRDTLQAAAARLHDAVLALAAALFDSLPPRVKRALTR